MPAFIFFFTVSTQAELQTQYKIAKTNRDALVVRGNELLEARYFLPETEQHFVKHMVAQIEPNDVEFKTVRTPVRDWFELRGRKLDKKTNPYYEVAQLADSMTKRNVGVAEITEKGKRKYHWYPWFSRISYIEGDGAIEAKFNNDLRPQLLQLKARFTAGTLDDSLKLKGPYAGRIFDFICQYETIGERYMSLEDHHEKLETGDKYPRYPDFRVNVIQPAHKQINERTSKAYSWKPVKSGRKVLGILYFEIISKDQAIEVSETTDEPHSTDLVTRLNARLGNTTTDIAQQLVDTYDADRINWHIDKFDRHAATGKKKGTGWLIDGIKDDWRPKLTPIEKAKASEQQQRKSEEAAANRRAEAIEVIEAACSQIEAANVRDFIENYSDDERADSEADFITQLQTNPTTVNQLIISRYENHGIDHPTVAVHYHRRVLLNTEQLMVDRIAYARDNGHDQSVIEALTNQSN